MDGFDVAIFRIADLPVGAQTPELGVKERYIGLIPEIQQSCMIWYASDTLFGLAKQMKDIRIIKWEEAERELASKGYFKIQHELNEEEKGFRDDARR